MTAAIAISPPEFFLLSKRLRFRLAITFLAALVLDGVLAKALALDGVELQLGQISGPAWRAADTRFEFTPMGGDRVGFKLSIGKLVLEPLASVLTDSVVVCTAGRLTDSQLACDRGWIEVQHALLDKPRLNLAFSWSFGNDLLEIRITDLRLAGGRLHAKLSGQAQRWSLDLGGSGLSLERLQALLPAAAPAGWTAAGAISFEAHVRLEDGRVVAGDWQTEYRDIELSDPAFDYAGAGLGGKMSGRMRRKGNVWDGVFDAALARGELLTPFFYLSLADQALRVKGHVGLDTQQKTIRVDSFELRHPPVLVAHLSAGIDYRSAVSVNRFTLRVEPIDLTHLYLGYLEPVMAEGPWEGLSVRGLAELDLDYSKSEGVSLLAELRGIDVELLAQAIQDVEPSKLFGLFGVEGRLVLTTDKKPPQGSRLKWSKGHVLENISLGPFDARLGITDTGIGLIAPAELPVLDGSLLIDSLFFALNSGAPGKVVLDGVLTPVSLQVLTEAVGIPPLAGKLSGVIPGISLQGGQLAVEGTLLVRIFDGRILVKNLRITDLFGALPSLDSDLELQNIDLEKLTSTFAFGKITGKLGGTISGLRLENWSPVAFDLSLATPDDDDTRHRISQKAVDNIANLGGAGISGALSRSILGMFEDFGYKRLGISCLLRNGVCTMGGVSPAESGYYLVEGAGIPRISIVGYNQRTDWALLLNQLKAISKLEAPVVE